MSEGFADMASDGQQKGTGRAAGTGFVAELRAQAACCRKLASTSERRAAAAALKALAEEVELRADALEARDCPPLR